MEEQRRAREDGDDSPVPLWLVLFFLGVLAVCGAFFASAQRRPGDYECGLLLSLAAIALSFMLLKSFFDHGGITGWTRLLLVEDWTSLAVIVPVLALLGLAGLFVAQAGAGGSLEVAGIAFFLACGLLVFMNLKRVFDRAESGPR